MGKKTIYVTDEGLWERARKLAGPEGMSAFIAEALRLHVAAVDAKRQGFQKFHLSYFGESMRVEGRLLRSLTNPTSNARADIYLTRAGALLLTITSPGEDDTEYYCTYDSIAELCQTLRDSFDLTEAAEATLRTHLRSDLGPDWFIRIE